MKKLGIVIGSILLLSIAFFFFKDSKFVDVKLHFFEACIFDGVKKDVVSFSSAGEDVAYRLTIRDSLGNKLAEKETKDTFVYMNTLNLKEDEMIDISIATLQKNKVYDKKSFTVPYGEVISRSPTVVSNRESGNVSGRKKIKLSTSSKKAIIYYTTDGSMPNEKSTRYQDPISLKETVTINAISYIEGMNPSYLSTYSYNVISTTPLIYLSPSTQEDNYGVKKVGFTTEEEMMNKIGDVVFSELQKANFIVYRNTKEMTAKSSAAASLKKDVDLHLAIHSNASPNNSGKYNGIETYIYNRKEKEAYDIASILQKQLVAIYYKKGGDRGVKNSEDIGGLRETNPMFVNNGILIEVAFHDNKKDAEWMVKNITPIGKAIAKGVIDYYS